MDGMPMTNDQFEKLRKQFKEDTGEYLPGDLPEPSTHCDAEIKAHIKYVLPIWKAWCRGRTRGLETNGI